MTINPTRFLALAAFLLAFSVAACDSDPSALVDEEATAAERTDLAARLSADLNLSTDQAQALNSLLTGAGAEEPAPGHLWTVAAALQRTLTDAQKATLFETVEQRTAALAEGTRGRRFNRGEKGKAPRFKRQGEPRAQTRPGFFTEAQQEQMKALRDAHRADMNALMEARHDGSLSQADVRERAAALRDAYQRAVQALLNDEQKATLEAKRSARKAAFDTRNEAVATAKADALDLSAEQETALASIHEEHQAERKALVEKIQAGDLDRDAMKAQWEASREAHKAALAGVLTPEQIEIVELYHALTGTVALDRARGRRFGGPRP